jgi:excisionase family DNA binding protein
LIYTVDEVSDLLSIPRPTLYRYLREYSIPHVRRSGKISIPEESFDRIKEARELHREGLGTVSVRRRMREVNDPVDTEELTERLDRLSGALQSLQGDLLRPVDGVSSSSQETLQTVLKKQDLLISAVSNLTGMVEDLLSTNVRPRAAAFDGVDEGTRREQALPEQYGGSLLTVEREVGRDVETDDSVTQDFSKSVEYFDAPTGREKFGTLARRRRRGILALLLVLVVSVVLAWGPLDLGGRVFGQSAPEEQSSVEEDSQSVPATDEEVPLAPQSVEVPDLVGMTLPEAEDKLADAGLKLGAWNEIPTYESSPGRVVTQGPRAGEEADPDSPVDLIVSTAPPAYQPDTTGGNVGGVDQYPGGVSQPSNQGNIPPAPF